MKNRAADSNTFRDVYSFDLRLVNALEKQEFLNPTAIQKYCLPILLTQLRSAFIQSSTGTGKTLIYVLCILERLLSCGEALGGFNAIILVPSKQLALQVSNLIKKLTTKYLPDWITYLNLSDNNKSPKFISTMLVNKPLIILSTPSTLYGFLESKEIEIKDSLKVFVIDEVDLILNFGYEDTLYKILEHVPQVYQGLMISATINESITKLNKLYLKDPVLLKENDILGEELDSSGELSNDSVIRGIMGDGRSVHLLSCYDSKNEKYSILYVILKLGLLKPTFYQISSCPEGRLLRYIIFTSDTKEGYRIALFLNKLHISCQVISRLLSLELKHKLITDISMGLISCLVVIDNERRKEGGDKKGSLVKEVADDRDVKETDDHPSRGIDFKNISVIINFDIPSCVETFVHRVGRGGRGSGIGLPYISLTFMNANEDKKGYMVRNESLFKTFNVSRKAIEPFYYRVEDVLSKLTTRYILELYSKEINNSILYSDKLKKLIFREEEAHISNVKGILHSRGIIEALNEGKEDSLKHLPNYLFTSGTSDAKSIRHDGKKHSDDSKVEKRPKRGHNGADPLKKIKI